MTNRIGDEYQRGTDSDCRRPGLMCKDALPRHRWCDICDARDQAGPERAP